jgi:hypothetical protein
MSKHLFIFIFLLYIAATDFGFAQQAVYSTKKQVTYYFEKKNPADSALFSVIGACPSDVFIKYHGTIEIIVFQEKERCFVQIKTDKETVECICRYNDFLLTDLITADKITLYGTITANHISLLELQFKEQEIPDSGLLLDTAFMLNMELNDVQFEISDVRFFIVGKGLEHLKEGLQQIDRFFLYDSLFFAWQEQVASFDMSNIDLLPLYPFQIKDIEQAFRKYDENEYERLLSKSGKDNSDYLQKRSSLVKRIADIRLDVSRKMQIIDTLLFERAIQFEEQGNLKEALFYYKRTLDYNPSHCNALKRLSDLYIQNNLYKENLELFTSLRLRGEDVRCESSWTSTVCDSICMKAAYLISKKNYYSAKKLLDTLAMLLYQIPDTLCRQTYQRLCKETQEGIYNSYFDVINKAIKGNKLALSKEYIYSLVAIMQNDGNDAVENDSFRQMMNHFISRYQEYVGSKSRRKLYEEVINENNAMLLFLDSIEYPYNEGLLVDLYTISYTDLYLVKKKQSEIDAADFLQKNRNYIILPEEKPYSSVILSPVPVQQDNPVLNRDDENRYTALLSYILTADALSDDVSLLDSVSLLLQLEYRPQYTNRDVDIFFLSEKVSPILMKLFSKINQYSWSNELSAANELMKRTTAALTLFHLDDSSALSQRYVQTVTLLDQRIAQQAEQEFAAFSQKVHYLIEQKQYSQAYLVLMKNDLYLRQPLYRKQMDHFMRAVETPALFEKKMASAQQDLALADFLSGFGTYQEAHTYFLENTIAQYGLLCDDLHTFIKKSEQQNFLKGACSYYIEKEKYREALDIMMYLIDLGYKSEEVQIALGTKMKRAGFRLADLSKHYFFGKVHHPFVKSLAGSFNVFWYRIKTTDLFRRKDKSQ